ncbi:MAG: hypothetical protein HY925_14895, partial [Elusimicrobia bacterium]|nr:hypothetical protein [Elusimicrobiota bacterium]
KVDTWENIKTQIAQGKTQGKGNAQKFWMMGDEMDGAALQPALTIGETTASVPKEHPAYRNLQGGIEKIERLLSTDARDLSQKLRFEASRQKTLVEGLKAENPATAQALEAGVNKLLKISQTLNKGGQADLAATRAEIEAIVQQQQAVIQAAKDFGAGPPKYLAAKARLSLLIDEIGSAKTERTLDAKMKEAQKLLAQQQSEIMSTPELRTSPQGKALLEVFQFARNHDYLNKKLPVAKRAAAGQAYVRDMVQDGEAAVARAFKAERVTEFLEAGSSISKGLAEGGPGEALDPKVVAKQVSKLMDQQTNVLWRAKWKSGSEGVKLQLEQLTNEARVKRARAEALRATDRTKAARLDAEVVALEAKVSSLESRSNAMNWLQDNATEIVQVAEKGNPGWEGRIRELLEQRRGVMDVAIDRENPIYTLFGQMKEKMYPLYASKLRVQDDAVMRLESPERMENGGAAQRQALVDKLDGLAKRLEARGDPKAAEARELVAKAQGELDAWKSGELVRKALQSKEPAELKTARESYGRASDELARIDAKWGETTVRVDQLFKESKALREQAATKKGKAAQTLLQKADVAESQAKQGMGEIETFKREANAKNLATRELYADYTTRYQRFLKENLTEVVSSFEKGAAENAEAWAAALKQKGFDGDALRARFRELNAQADAAADPVQASNLRKQAGLVQNDLAALEGVTSELGSRAQLWKSEGVRLRMDSEAALKTHFERIDGVSTTELAARGVWEATLVPWAFRKTSNAMGKLAAKAPVFEGAARTMGKLAGTPFFRGVDESTVGLTRAYAGRLLRAVASDPFMTPSQRWQLMWGIMPSAIWPRGIGYHLANWKGTPLLGAAAAWAMGFPLMSWQFGLTSGGVSMLPQLLTKGLGIQPSGETWVRRELFNLARGYTDNPATERFDNNTRKVNAVHNGQWFESMDTPTRRFWELHYGADLTLPYEHKAIVTMNDFVRDNKNVRFVGLSGTAGPEFRRYLTENGVRITGTQLASTARTDVALRVFESPAGKYQAVLDAVKAAQPSGELVIVSLSDTRSLKMAREALRRAGVKDIEIAQVFSDTELLRVNNPEANVSKQTNLHNLTSGAVKVLLLDTRVAGRGLDLNFKGIRGTNDPKAFKGYTKFKFYITDPQQITQVHEIQANGRIGGGRTLDGSVKEFELLMDAPTAQQDPVFMDMLKTEPRFVRLMQEPEVKAIALRNGRTRPTWVDLQTYIDRLEAAGQRPEVTIPYRDVVRGYLIQKQGDVENDQLRGSSVKQDRPAFNPLMRGLDGWAR